MSSQFLLSFWGRGLHVSKNWSSCLWLHQPIALRSCSVQGQHWWQVIALHLNQVWEEPVISKARSCLMKVIPVGSSRTPVCVLCSEATDSGATTVLAHPAGNEQQFQGRIQQGWKTKAVLTGNICCCCCTCHSALYSSKLSFLASRSASLILRVLSNFVLVLFKKIHWKKGHVEISVSFFMLWGEEKLAKVVRRAQQVLCADGFAKDEASWSSKINLQDSCPFSWGIQVGRSGPASRDYSFLSFSERKSQAFAQLLSRQGKLHLSICTGSEKITVTFLHQSVNTHLTQAVFCQQQPISRVQTHHCTVYIS